MAWNLILRITPEADADDVELDQQVYSLCRELLELPIESAEPAHAADLRPGAKSSGAVIAGAVSVTGVTPLVLRAIVDLCKSWMERTKARRIQISRGDTTVDLTAASARTEREVARLLEQLLRGDTDTDE